MKSILSYLNGTADRLPDKLAFSDGEKGLTFRQLRQAAAGIGACLKNGGALQIVEHSLEIEVAPESIPEFIEVSVAGLEVGDTLHIDALKLPAGVSLTSTKDLTLVTIIPPTVEAEEPAAAEVEAEAAKA